MSGGAYVNSQGIIASRLLPDERDRWLLVRREAEEAVLGVFGDAQVAVAVAAAEVRFGERVRGEHETKEDSTHLAFC